MFTRMKSLSIKLAGICLLLILSLTRVGAQEKILLDGSTGMLPLARALAKAYQAKYAEPQVELGKGLGTEARMPAVQEDKIQIALASHGIDPEEVRKKNLRVAEIAKGAIVFAVNSSVSLAAISDREICDIYSGKITSWKTLSGADVNIAVLTRPAKEVDPQVIREKVACFKELKEVETVQVMERGGDMAKGLAETPHAIGTTSMTVVEQSGGKVKALTFNGVAPTPENVKTGKYFLTRDFLFVTRAEPSPSVKKFLNFVLSPEGDKVIEANGAVPLR